MTSPHRVFLPGAISVEGLCGVLLSNSPGVGLAPALFHLGVEAYPNAPASAQIAGILTRRAARISRQGTFEPFRTLVVVFLQ